MKLRKVDINDFPNYKRKLVVLNIPLDVEEEEVMNYFFTILNTVSKTPCKLLLFILIFDIDNKNPIMSVKKYKELGFVTLEFRKREDAETCLHLDGTEYKTGYKMRIMRVKRFMDEWNEDIGKGKNPLTS